MMTQEYLFASFILDKSAGMEIALQADVVTEATSISGSIKTLPAGIDFLEGIMRLREDVIPVVNLKKRLGLKESSYGAEAKVAVITLFDTRYGLLFDDIKEVFRIGSDKVRPVEAVLQTDDKIISSFISLENGKRVVEILDPKRLFRDGFNEEELNGVLEQTSTIQTTPVSYLRYVVFSCSGQKYGVPVHCSQEITFLSRINEMFKSGCVEGALQLRGQTIPVINSRNLLPGNGQIPANFAESGRILVLSSPECVLGLMVDEIKEIIMVPENEILPMPSGKGAQVSGIYHTPKGENIMLLDMPNLVCEHIAKIKSIAKINTRKEAEEEVLPASSHEHHLITENCYLIFAIEKNFAIKIKDVQEIIEKDGTMGIPGASGFNAQVINLRNTIVPIVDLRCFYNYSPKNGQEKSKLIICRSEAGAVALEVDRIVTIYKQEEFHVTPSLHAQLAPKKDTLDRLIDFVGADGISEHVLVVNIDNLIRNHMAMAR
jgi:purine-binding chemotaxis protein CheW